MERANEFDAWGFFSLLEGTFFLMGHGLFIYSLKSAGECVYVAAARFHMLCLNVIWWLL